MKYLIFLTLCSLISFGSQFNNIQMKTKSNNDINVLGTQLEICCTSPLTGFYRDGLCRTDENDYGIHTVCAVVTTEFLNYSKSRGNNLMDATPWFPGLKEGDKWCLCAGRWLEAYNAGFAPKVDLNATNIKTLDLISLEILKEYSIDNK